MATFEKKQEKTSYKDLQQLYQTGYYENLNDDTPTSLPLDYATPYSFNEWIKAQDAVEPNSQYEFYLKYISEWYKNKFTTVEAKNIIKTNYVNLLKQLNIVFKDEVSEKWFSDLSYDSDLDIQDMIEFYSKKLKQIAYFLAEKRETIKRTKIKYNTVGSNFGAAKLFTDYLLNAFTQRPFAYNVAVNDVIKKFPALSGINTSFQITVKELYDQGDYFDRNPNKSTTNYYNTTSDASINFLTSIGLSSTDAQWFYSLGNYDTVVSAPTTTTLSLSDYGNVTDKTLISDLLVSLTEKYIGTPLYDAIVTNTENASITAVYNIVQGNNWFYWPSGEYVFENNDLQIKSIALSATTLLSPFFTSNNQISATASTEYINSDKIFVLDYQGLKGAWAQSVSSESITKTMSAMIMGNDHLLFKFPFPGYGEASDTLPWTGKSYENITGLYRFLDRDTKKIIESYYFSNTATEAIPVTPISINDTTLVDSGAKPAKQYEDADKIIFRNANNPDRIHDATPNAIFTDDLEYVWLYDMTRTNLAANAGQTNILWPLQTYTSSPDQTFAVPEDFCAQVPLSSLNHTNFIGSRSGTGLYDADIIYILDGINGTPTQAAFLSARPIKDELQRIGAGNTRFTAEISGTHQPGLFLKCLPGQYTTFLWADSSIDINNTNIKYHEIPVSSNYRKISHNSIYETRLKTLQTVYNESSMPAEMVFQDFGIGPGIGDWKTDNSRSILFSPIGHPGNTYNDYDKMCDIIFVDHTYPAAFTLASWRDKNGKDYTQSPDFAWFKLDNANVLQPDVGWGPGSWVNFNGTGTFVLSAGYQYKYLRANLRRSVNDLQLQAVPYMVIKEPYKLAETKWVLAEYNGNSFTQTISTTDIILAPGTPFIYDHYNTTTYCLTTEDTRGLGATTDYPRLSSTDNAAWMNYNLVETGQTILATWPNTIFSPTVTSGPSPLSSASVFDAITWQVSSKSLAIRTNTLNPFGLFSLELSANNEPIEYTILAVGKVLSGTILNPIESYYLKVTAVPVTLHTILTGSLVYNTIQNFTIPVDICVPLSGWNINTSKIDNNSLHAKPIWVTATDENTTFTLNKGVPISDRTYSFEYEFIMKYQPEISTISINSNTVMDYVRKGTKPLTWVQPLVYTNDKKSYQWKKLNITSISSPLSDFTCEQFNIQNVEATSENSDIILTPPDNTGLRRQYINYYAINEFTWTQPLFLKKIAPTATTLTLSSVATPEFELLNLLNRHYPTVATVPDVNSLYNEDQVGIYTPTNLGLPVYLGKSHITEISATSGFYSNISNPDVFESDFGFTKQLNISPVTRKKYNAIWMKTPATFIAKSGIIQNSKPYEKFNPYQNKYEIIDRNTTGINYVTDIVDPWTGEQDKTWRPTNPSTTDFRGVNNVNAWLNTFVTPTTSQVYDWATDLYGNNYALLKPIHKIDPYNQSFINGEIWVRTIDNELSRASQGLKSVLEDFKSSTAIYDDATNNRIQRLAIIEDKLIITTPNGVGATRIYYDYSNKQIKTSNNEFTTFVYSNSSTVLSNILQIPEIRKVLMPISVSDQFTIKLLEYNLDTNYIKDGFANNAKIADLSAYLLSNNLNELTSPVITYNPNTKLYNISLLARNSNTFTGDYLISIVFEHAKNTYVIKKIDKLTP